MNTAAATSTRTKSTFVGRVRELLAEAWRLHLETCAIVAEAHRRPH